MSNNRARPIKKLLIANRGEIAVRISSTGRDLGIETVSVGPRDDIGQMHTERADEHIVLNGEGPEAYLDVEQLVSAARGSGCDGLHPGYGFLSEHPSLSEACSKAGLTFVGASAGTLELLGNKASAIGFAAEAGVRTLAPFAIGDEGDLADAIAEVAGPVMLKAVMGGGGRGMGVVRSNDDPREAIARCRSEAKAAFGDGALYAEAFIAGARHIEVQVIGDGSGATVVLGDRECSLQRRHQKLIEFAPAFGVGDDVIDEVRLSAVKLASGLRCSGLVTFEFLVDSGHVAYFTEANARLQVEHTVTEEVTGLDLVELQLRVAGGESLPDVGLVPGHSPSSAGVAIEARLNAEAVDRAGSALPTSGEIVRFEPPTGPGIRTDSHARAGMVLNPRFDPMFAKVIAHAPDRPTALRRLSRALDETVVEGIETNIEFLRAVLDTEEVLNGAIDTTFVEVAAPSLDFGGFNPAVGPRMQKASSPDAVTSPIQGTIVEVTASVGQSVASGTNVVVIEAMKMEHVISVATAGIVTAVLVGAGDQIAPGDELVRLDPSTPDETVEDLADRSADSIDPDHVRPDLAASVDRHEVGLDHRRPDAVAKRRALGRRTARENVDDLVDDDSFIEYGALAIAPQRRRRAVQELIEKTPADGMVGGIGTINGEHFGQGARCAVVSYDYTVLAGTQGGQNHRKKDRLFELAEQMQLPVVLFAEGGGGRPGDTDGMGVAGLDCLAFALFGGLSGRVPLVGINTGYCFAGNAALLGMCDVIIATTDSNAGMGGPAMIEGGGLGEFHPREIGPAPEQFELGVVDILVEDDSEAVSTAKRYLSYFQGTTGPWTAPDQRLLRHVVPENRLRVYDIRSAIDLLADVGSVLELRSGWGVGMVTALARIEGRAVGIIANNPKHLAGAIDSDGADKAARFMQLCDGFGVPIVFLCDTPGIMVGPDAEKSGTVRHAARMFVTGAGMSVPFCTIVTRKGYGLGAQAMAGGSFKSPIFTVSWPTGEFGGMGLEGAVRLGYRRELEAISDQDERAAAFNDRVDRMYEIGKALNFASAFEIDDVIDPADSRRWILAALISSEHVDSPEPRRPNIDTW